MTMNIDERLLEIDQELSQLHEERDQLEARLREIKDDKWGEDGMRDKLRKTILSRYGSVHPIKLAVLRLNGMYDDEGYDYDNASLVLIDADFNEIKHDIRAKDFAPSREEQYQYMKQSRKDVCENVTLKFA